MCVTFFSKKSSSTASHGFTTYSIVPPYFSLTAVLLWWFVVSKANLKALKFPLIFSGQPYVSPSLFEANISCHSKLFLYMVGCMVSISFICRITYASLLLLIYAHSNNKEQWKFIPFVFSVLFCFLHPKSGHVHSSTTSFSFKFKLRTSNIIFM